MEYKYSKKSITTIEGKKRTYHYKTDMKGFKVRIKKEEYISAKQSKPKRGGAPGINYYTVKKYIEENKLSVTFGDSQHDILNNISSRIDNTPGDIIISVCSGTLLGEAYLLDNLKEKPKYLICIDPGAYIDQSEIISNILAKNSGVTVLYFHNYTIAFFQIKKLLLSRALEIKCVIGINWQQTIWHNEYVIEFDIDRDDFYFFLASLIERLKGVNLNIPIIRYHNKYDESTQNTYYELDDETIQQYLTKYDPKRNDTTKQLQRFNGGRTFRHTELQHI